MRIDYETIVALAAVIGCRRDDLIALSPGNDPFYILPGRREAAEWFASLWENFDFKIGSHPRRLHYVLVSQSVPVLKPNGERYQNTENDWKYLLTSSLAARYLRLVPDGALSDHRNDPPIIHANGFDRTLPTAWVQSSAVNLSCTIQRTHVHAPYMFANDGGAPQRYLVELWIEKSTQNDILLPLARRLEFNLVAGTGETSETLARQAIERAVEDGRPMRILYISDFDPGGRSMPVALARKLEFWLRETGLDLDITLAPIALTPDQCEHYRLPRTPLKDTERRAPKFEERFGSGATELDALEALHPGELQNIVEAEVTRYIDMDLRSRVYAANSAFRQVAKTIEREIWDRYDINSYRDRYNEIIDRYEGGLREEVDHLNNDMEPIWETIAEELEANLPAAVQEFPEATIAEEPADPLFDSRREYLDQIDHYRRWQGKGGAS